MHLFYVRHFIRAKFRTMGAVVQTPEWWYLLILLVNYPAPEAQGLISFL